MKILYVTSELGTESGWGRMADQIVREAKKHAEVSVLKVTHDPSVFGFFLGIFATWRQSKDVDVLHALDGWPYAFYVSVAALLRGKKFFITAIGTYAVAPLYQRGKSPLLRYAYQHAEQIFCLSTYTKDHIVSTQKLSRISVVNFGSNRLGVPTTREIEAVRERYGLKQSDYPVIVTVGAIKERKGQLDTLKAVALLRERYPHIRYVLIGSTDDLSYIRSIEAYIKEQKLEHVATIAGMVEDATLAALYAVSTMLALNSNNDGLHFEGYGMVILEAGAFGKPAVGSQDTGIEELIKNGITGYLTLQKNHHDIAEKIERVLNEYSVLSTGARLFETEHTWEKTVATYMEAYHKII